MNNTNYKNLKRTNASNSLSRGNNESTSENENAIIKLLKKIFNLKVIATVAGVIAAVAAVLSIWPPHKAERLKNEINKYVYVIEDSFHPNLIAVDQDTSPDALLVKDFQITTLNLVTYWKAINNMQSITEYKTTDSQDILNIVASQLTTINNFMEEATNVFNKISALQNCGNDNNIVAYQPTPDKLYILMDKAKIRQKKTTETNNTIIKNISELLIKYSSNPSGVPYDKLVKAVKPCEKLYNSVESLDYIRSLFAYCIELNTMYVNYLNNNVQ